MRILHEFVQGTEEWENFRRIRPSASRFSEIFTAVKGDLSKSAEKYALEIVTQARFKSNPDPAKWTGNAFTDIGNEREAEARSAWSEATGLIVEQVGFCVEDAGFFGCSPDGLITGYGSSDYVAGLELKCPSSTVHMGYLLAGVLPADYVQQVHGSMLVTGLRNWYFASYFPGLPMFRLTVNWDEAYAAKMTAAMDEFRILYATTKRRVDELFKKQAA